MGSDFAGDPRIELSTLRASCAYAFAHSSDCSRVDPGLAWVHEREQALLERIHRTSRVAHIAEDPARPRYGLCGTPLPVACRRDPAAASCASTSRGGRSWPADDRGSAPAHERDEAVEPRG